MFFAPSKLRQRAKIWIIGISKTSDHIHIKIKMPNPSQEPPVSSKAPNEDLKDMDVLCTFKIEMESQNLNLGCSDHVQSKIKMPIPSQEPAVSSKAQNDMDVLCSFKIKIERKNYLRLSIRLNPKTFFFPFYLQRLEYVLAFLRMVKVTFWCFTP